MENSINTCLLAVSLQPHSFVRGTPTPDPLLNYSRIRLIPILLSGGQTPLESVGIAHHHDREIVIGAVTKPVS